MKQLFQGLLRALFLLLSLAVPANLDSDRFVQIDKNNEAPANQDSPYKSLADVSEKYHDGEKLTGCFVGDSIGRLMHPSAIESVDCWNPFYWDEHGNLRNWYKRFRLPSEPFPPLGIPREYKPAPCEGCLNEEQAIDIFRVYHREIGVKPLGYRARIIRDFPWDGRRSIDYRDCGEVDPHPGLDPYARVNLPRKMRPFTMDYQLGEKCRDPQNRDLTWRVSFQVGWIESRDIQKKVDRGHYHKSALAKDRVPCVASHIVHAQTGNLTGDRRFHLLVPKNCSTRIDNLNRLDGYKDDKAFYETRRRVYLYLPDSPYRKSLQPPPKKQRKKPSLSPKQDSHRQLQDSNNRFNIPRHSTTTGAGKQHILVYWGDDPSYRHGTPRDCITEDDDGNEIHDSRCEKRVPKIKQCDASNVPIADPDNHEGQKFDCILWSRIDNSEKCWYTNIRGKIRPKWCERKSPDGRTHRGSGITSKEIHKHIDAVHTLTGHRVGMRYNDPDFASQRSRLADLFSDKKINAISDDDAVAEINLFDPDVWESKKTAEAIREVAGFYIHRYGKSHWDDPENKTKENNQYRRINSRFDWYTYNVWCSTRPRLPVTNCESKREWRYRYTLVHEATHDVTDSRLLDQFHHPNHPILNIAQWRTKGVLEGHALFIEEQAGRDRGRSKLDLDRKTTGDYQLRTENAQLDRPPDTELSTETDYVAAGENLLLAMRELEEELPNELTLAALSLVAKPFTRNLFNQTLHLFKPIDDYTGRWNKHVDFCEVRNGIHNLVWALRRTQNPLAAFNEPQPHVSGAFDYASIYDCRFVLPPLGSDYEQPDGCANVTPCSLPSP